MFSGNIYFFYYLYWYFLCVFRDEDMQSLASLMSVNSNDIAPLGDFDDDEDTEGNCHCIIINLP